MRANPLGIGRRSGLVRALWDTTKARTTSRNARPAASKASACRPRRTPRRRPCRQPRSGLAPAGFFPAKNPSQCAAARPPARSAEIRGAHASRVLAKASPPLRTFAGRVFGCGALARVGASAAARGSAAAEHSPQSPFRRDAETNTRDACAPRTRRTLPACGHVSRNLTSRPFSLCPTNAKPSNSATR